MAERQRTIINQVSLSGTGLHTGAEVIITFKPAQTDFGYRFVRTDIKEHNCIQAIAENVVDTSRSTVIGNGTARVSTIEHALSAAYGLGIDNLLIEVNGPETPILDGSSRYYAEALLKAGITEQNKERDYFEIKNVIRYVNSERSIEILGLPDDSLSLNVMIDYNSEVLGNQYAFLNDFEQYQKEIAPCKTFVFFKELEFLLKQNLIKGGDLDNALVIVEKMTTQEECDRLADLFGKPRTEYHGQGILNQEDLIYPNEPARHKLLDLIGDLSLAGRRIKGKIIAMRPGHFANSEFVKLIRTQIKMQDEEKKTLVNPEAPPVLDINQVRKLLPHRAPFLFVDKIMQLTKESIIGIKNITADEPVFQGHFPENPIMPESLITESMIQTASLLIRHNKQENGKLPDLELAQIEKADFFLKIIPGDTLILSADIVKEQDNEFIMNCTALSGKNEAARIEITLRKK